MLSSLWHSSQSTKACGAWEKLLTSHDKAECQKNGSREEPNLGMGVNSLEGMEDSHNTDEQKARMHYEELLVQKDKEINLLKLRIIAQKHDQDITVNLLDRTTNDTISDIDSAVESSCQSKSSILASKHTVATGSQARGNKKSFPCGGKGTSSRRRKRSCSFQARMSYLL